ncbi:phosphotransferase [Psychromicrobium xiongbiense]|uniref:phosphotransferase n=1 Tax=Psychromicrobium xiongbiense TaxID=3051184 RepID=UPI00255368E9|nr:phosphotransferase [Psychromicrobium sp. YIM S02556]
MPMPTTELTPWSARIGWSDLPEQVRSGVEQILGASVVEATGQQGGFSPGTADRVRTATGRRAFVKAVSAALNSSSPEIHRKEAAVTAQLPLSLPVAHWIGMFDDGEWVALVLEDIEGRSPQTPWQSAELQLVLEALLEIAEAPVPVGSVFQRGLTQLPRLEEELRESFAGWTRLKEASFPVSDPWAARHLDRLEELAARGLSYLPGESLVHTDVRADNILLIADADAAGSAGGVQQADRAVLVDWPWACHGVSWMDALTLLVNVRVFDPAFDVEEVLASHPVFAPATDDGVSAVLAGLAAYLVDAARLPAPEGLPTLRSFQQRQGEAILAWLRERTDW